MLRRITWNDYKNTILLLNKYFIKLLKEINNNILLFSLLNMTSIKHLFSG